MINTNRIKARIVELGLTQHSMAKKMGLRQSTLSLKINGKRPLYLDEAQQIAAILDLNIDEFKNYFFSKDNCVAQLISRENKEDGLIN